MKKVLVVVGLVLLLGLGTLSYSQTIVGTKHDLSTSGNTTSYRSTNVDRVCVFCHTPHQATAANAQDPLWNHTLSSNATYGTYSSVTLNASVTELGGASAGSAAISNLCLSCHDGTVGVGSLYNSVTPAPSNASTQITGTALVGTDLSDDHPVNFTYDSALATEDGELEDPSAVTVPLFGGTVQCASCHDVHDDTNTPFLVIDNAGSALCLDCHTK